MYKRQARQWLKDERDVEEAVQDTFFNVYRKIHMFRQEAGLWSWIYRITVNSAKMKIRKFKRIPIPMEDDTLASLSRAEETTPEQLVNRDRMLVEIDTFLAECDDLNRSLYLAMDVEGRNKEEVASELDLTVSALKTRLHRVRAGLRERLTLYAGA